MKIIDGIEVSEELYAHAWSLFEDDGMVIDYLRSKPRSLGGKSPLEYIKEGNEKEIDREIGRIEWGVL